MKIIHAFVWVLFTTAFAANNGPNHPNSFEERLFVAAAQGNYEVVRMLLESNVHPNFVSSELEQAIGIARENHQYHVAELLSTWNNHQTESLRTNQMSSDDTRPSAPPYHHLLEEQSSSSSPSEPFNEHGVVRAVRGFDFHNLNALLDSGHSIMVSGVDGKTPLQIAVEGGFKEAVLLIKRQYRCTEVDDCVTDYSFLRGVPEVDTIIKQQHQFIYGLGARPLPRASKCREQLAKFMLLLDEEKIAIEQRIAKQKPADGGPIQKVSFSYAVKYKKQKIERCFAKARGYS